jgi:septal ring factor EnvC (AmiA/AmiB activator)
LDPLAFLAEHSTALWSAASGAVSGIGLFLISFWKVSASVEHARMKMAAEAAKVEIAERAAFRASLMNELAGLRAQIKACEADKNQLRERLYNAEAEILVLKASNEIMEKWVAFFRDGLSPQASSLASVTRREVRL